MGARMRLLVIEDDPTIAGFVRQGLEELSYAVDVVGDGKAGEIEAASGEYDVLILDVMLPGQSGIDVCRRLRQRGVSTPILMLTALSSTGNKVEGLQSGADDYLVKPFDFEELAARVQALLRASPAPPPLPCCRPPRWSCCSSAQCSGCSVCGNDLQQLMC